MRRATKSYIVAVGLLISTLAMALTINGELKKAQFERLATDPTGITGRVYFNTGTNKTRIYDGAVWGDLGGLAATSLLLSDGTFLLPSLSFINSSTSGLYRKAADSLGFAANAIEVGFYSALGAWTLGPSSTVNTNTTALKANGTIAGNFGINIGKGASGSVLTTAAWYRFATVIAGGYGQINCRGDKAGRHQQSNFDFASISLDTATANQVGFLPLSTARFGGFGAWDQYRAVADGGLVYLEVDITVTVLSIDCIQTIGNANLIPFTISPGTGTTIGTSPVF